jgi:5'-3' exonuclease
MKTVAIDTDLQVYQIGFSCQQLVDFGDGEHHYADKRKAVGMMEKEVARIRLKFGSDANIVYCLSDPKQNFRKEVLETYKQNRSVKPGAGRPLLFNFIREWFTRHTQSRWEHRLEADDLLGIMATSPLKALMVSIDKDLLTIPGTLYDPKTLTPVVTDAKTATRNHYFQTLVGDSVDNYKGIPRVGKVKATKLLDADCSWEAVQDAFIAHYSTKLGEPKIQAIARAVQQARVAYILMYNDYDFHTQTVTLWTPPAK